MSWGEDDVGVHCEDRQVSAKFIHIVFNPPKLDKRVLGAYLAAIPSFSVCPQFPWWSGFFESAATTAQDRGGFVAFNPSICTGST
jgi:hypothetical protein